MLVGDQIGPPQHQPPQHQAAEPLPHSHPQMMAKSATSTATIVKTKVLMMEEHNADNIQCDDDADDHDNSLTCQQPSSPEASQKVDLLRNCRGISNGLTLSDVEAARGVAMVSSSPSSPSMASARYLTATAQSTTVPMMQRCSKHRLKTSPKRKIPFIKANGFCSQDYVVQSSPGSSSEVAELKWDLRSQIHPTSIAVSAPSPTAAAADTEQPPKNNLQEARSSLLVASESLLNPATDLPLPRRLSSIRRRCSSRLSATTSFESFNEMNMLSQVNMSGLRAATDENREKSRRFLWVFLLTICFAVMVAQITDRVRHFLSEPVSVQVTVARNNSLIYPAITICNKNTFNISAMAELRERSRHHHRIFTEKSDDIASLLALPNMDAHKLWSLTSHSKKSMIKECWFGRNVTCDDRGHWTATLTTMGVCQTYTLNDSMVHLAGIFHNMYLQLEEAEDEYYKDDSGWKFHIHDTNEVPILAVTTHGTSLYPGQGRDMRLDMKKIEALHHPRNPCEANKMYLQNNCFIDCFMKRLAQENITCRLPYMTSINLPYCNTPESYRVTEKTYKKLYFFGQWNPNTCSCRQQCSKMLFTSSLESTTDRFQIADGRTRARVRVYYQNLEFEYIKEDVGYGTIDLLCDVGGTLSLLMGASLLTCCELLEVAWIVVAKKCCRKVKKTLTRRKRSPAAARKSEFDSSQKTNDAPSSPLSDGSDVNSGLTAKFQTKV